MKIKSLIIESFAGHDVEIRREISGEDLSVRLAVRAVGIASESTTGPVTYVKDSETRRECIYHCVVPMTFGRTRLGGPKCTNSEAFELVDQIEKLFW